MTPILPILTQFSILSDPNSPTPILVIETYIESINELHDLLSQIEKIDGIVRAETAFIRRIVKERFDFGTPKYLTESEDETAVTKKKK